MIFDDHQGNLLIRGGRIIDPSQQLDHDGDLLIEEGKISAIDLPGRIPENRARQVIDAKGKWVLPGLIDVHVHLREPGLEYKETIETGTRAAVAGGFTSVACMANTHPVNDTPYVTAFIREKAKASAACRVFPVGAVTKGLKGQELAEIGGMVREGAMAISDDGMPVMNSYLMRKAMDYAKAFGVPIISHAEDWNLVGQGAMNEGALSTSRPARQSCRRRRDPGGPRDRPLPPHPLPGAHRAHLDGRGPGARTTRQGGGTSGHGRGLAPPPHARRTRASRLRHELQDGPSPSHGG